MLIYCNGDSYTAGHGLGDYLLPGYPGDTNKPPQIDHKTTEWVKNTYRPGAVDRTNYKIQIQQEESRLCWPGKLKSMGYNVINSAQGGASMNRIARTTITDLIELKKTESDILAIVSVPPTDRSEVFYENSWHSITHHNMDSFKHMPGIPEYCELKVIHDLKGYAGYINWYLSAIAIKDFCNANGIELWWINSVNDVPKMLNDFSDVNILAQYLNIRYEVEMHLLSRNSNGNIYVADGHYSEHIQNMVSSIIDIKLKNLKI